MGSQPGRLIRRGRNLLIAQFAYVAISSVAMLLWRVEGDPSRADYRDVLGFVLELALFSAVWHGCPWAKWLMVGLCLAAAVAAALIARTDVRPDEMRVVVIALALFYAWIAVSLVASRSINAFLNHDRTSDPSR